MNFEEASFPLSPFHYDEPDLSKHVISSFAYASIVFYLVFYIRKVIVFNSFTVQKTLTP